jgi:hypothetical protein
MDDVCVAVARFISGVATANETLAVFGADLRSRPDVEDVKRGMDIRAYNSGTVVEMYVDAQRRDGIGQVWWLDILQETERWVIEARVTMTGAVGQESVLEFDTRTAIGADDLVRELQRAISDLISYKDLPVMRSPD